MLVICDSQQTAEKLSALGIECATHINGNIMGRECTIFAESEDAVRHLANVIKEHKPARLAPLPAGISIDDVPRRIALLEQHIAVKAPSAKPSKAALGQKAIAGVSKQAPLWECELDEQAQIFSDATSTAVEMADLAMLSAVGGMVAGVFDLEIKPMWREPSIFNGALCDEPGGGKSPLLNQITSVIFQQQMDILNAKTIDASGTAKDRFIWSDTTAEAIFRDCGATGKGGLKFQDELDGHYGKGAMSRYKQSSDRTLWKSAWNGSPNVIDRVGTRGITKPIVLPCWGISVLGGIQPARLDLIFDGLDDGLADRVPIIMAERRPVSKYGAESAESTTWELVIEQLVQWRRDSTERVALPLTEGARELFLEHRFKTLTAARESGRQMEGWLAKSFAHIARVALITTVASHALAGVEPEHVDAVAIERGIAYQTLLNSHRRRARLEVGTPNIERIAQECARFIVEGHIEQIDPYELRMNRQVPGLRNEQVVREVLSELEQARWISTAIPRRRDEPLPKIIRVNPDVHNMRIEHGRP